MFLLSFSTLLYSILFWGPLVAHADFRFVFQPSPIQQCQPVNILFQGSQSKSFKPPKSLTILPFDSQPISLPVDGASRSSAGISLTFLPVQSGVQFLASFDDTDGDNSGKVSDVFHVVNDTGTDNCLPTPRNVPPPPEPIFAQSLPASVSQCQPFTVDIDSGAPAPNIRAFIPGGGAHMLQVMSQSETQATYMMDLPHLTNVFLVAFDSGSDDITKGFTAKNILTVQGDASSDTSCFKKNNSKGGKNGNSSRLSDASSSPLSKGAVAGIVVGIIAFAILIVAIGLFLLRMRNIRKAKSQRALAGSFNPWMLEKSTFSTYPTPQQSFVAAEEGFVKNPPYVREYNSRFSFASTAEPQTQSWAPDQPLSPLRYQEGRTQLSRQLSSNAASSINTRDIEQMLNYTAAETSRSHVKNDVPIASGYSQPYGSTATDAFISATPRSQALPTGASQSFTDINPFGDFGDNGPLRESPVPLSELGSVRTPRDSFVSIPPMRSPGEESDTDAENFQIVTITRPQPALAPSRSGGRLNSLPSSVKLAANNSFTSAQLVRVGSTGSSGSGSNVQAPF